LAEQQHIEWKQSWRDEYLQWICAFANTDGGTLCIGINDKGEVIGLDNPKRLLEDIPSKIKSHLGIISDVKLREDGENQFIEIVTHPYSVPISYKGKFYIRSGSTTHELNGVELMEFLLAKSGKTWDEVVEENAVIEDIDHDAIHTLIADSAGKGRLPEVSGLSDLEILQKLRLADGGQIKRSGIVLFGLDPNKFVPNCKVMIGRFGEDSEDLKFQESLEGSLVYLLSEVQAQLNHKFLIRPVDFKGMMRQETDEYPVEALREMLLNALVHKKQGGAAIQIRVFDDYLSIWNEGTLPKGLTVESLKRAHNSKPPNPLIADACFKAGYIDTWGRGTLKIYKACQEAGLPEPRITEKDGGIEVTIFKITPSEKLRRKMIDLSEKVQNNFEKNLVILDEEYGVFIDFLADKNKITSEELRSSFGEKSSGFRTKYGDKPALLLFLLALRPSSSAKEAAEKVGVSSRTIETYIAELKEEGLLERIGPDKGGNWSIKVNANK